jgi:hypothetical protein
LSNITFQKILEKYPNTTLIGNEEKYIFQKFSSYPFILNNPLTDIIAVKYIAGIIDERTKKTIYDENFWKIYFSSFPINVVFGYFSSIFWNVILDKVLRRKEA